MILKDIIGELLHVQDRKVETSLIVEFQCPKLDSGQLWEITASEIEKMGGTIIKNARVTKLHKSADHVIRSLSYKKDGETLNVEADYVISSMPLKDLVAGMNDIPEAEAAIAKVLPYRDYMTLGVLVPKLALVNKTPLKTVSNIVPDCWVYLQDRRVKLGRFQIYNNWSPYMIKGLEYFVNEGDGL